MSAVWDMRLPVSDIHSDSERLPCAAGELAVSIAAGPSSTRASCSHQFSVDPVTPAFSVGSATGSCCHQFIRA